MRGRTFFRIMIENLFINNHFAKAIRALVNFCNDQTFYKTKKLKFLEKMPLNKIEQSRKYDKRFIFNNNQISGVNLK